MEQQLQRVFKLIIDMEESITSIKDNISDIIDIAKLPGLAREESDLLLSEAQMMSVKITKYEVTNNMVKDLLNKMDDQTEEKTDNTSSSEEISMTEQEKNKEKTFDYTTAFLRPQKVLQIKEKIPPKDNGHPALEAHEMIMRELYSLTNNDTRFIDFSGIYPRLNFLQDNSPEEIRKWYDFGAINTIYMFSPGFREISLLPHWIKEGVKDFYLHNPTVSPKDSLVLKLYSAGPDFWKEERYPAYHFMQVAKAEALSISVPKERKDFKYYGEKDVHYRRAIGIRIILQQMENSSKRGFRTYGGKKMYSSIMISPAKRTPLAAERYMETKIKMLDNGTIKSSPEALLKICQYRQHSRDRCPACSTHKGKMPESDNHSTKTLTSDSDDE